MIEEFVNKEDVLKNYNVKEFCILDGYMSDMILIIVKELNGKLILYILLIK